MTREEIVAEARARLGIRWQHQGRGSRLDCLGLVHASGRSTIALPADYKRQPTGELRKMLDRHMNRARGPELGRVALMQFDKDEPHHVGIIGDYFAGGWSLIHAYVKARKVVEQRLDDEWLNRCVAFYDFPGVA